MAKQPNPALVAEQHREGLRLVAKLARRLREANAGGDAEMVESVWKAVVNAERSVQTRLQKRANA